MPPTSLRDIVLTRIEQTIRRTFGDDGDVIDELDLKSDEELLSWYERIVGLDRKKRPSSACGKRRDSRLDPAGFE